MAPADFPVPKSFTKAWHSKPYPFISPSRPELSMAGKNVIVTGGGTGIGLAISTAFAKAGAKSVSILGRRPEPLEKAVAVISNVGTTKVLYQAADLTNHAQVEKAFKMIAEQVGKIDILVSNAGMLSPPGLIVGYNSETFMKSFEGNVLPAFNAVQAFLPLAGPEPILLSTNTSVATSMLMPGISGYAVSKAANLKLLEYLAAENPHLHVVNIQPGWVPTDINGHQAEAPDVAELPGEFYVWLASAEAKFLKNKFVWANWDAQELLERADEIKNSKLLEWVVEGV